MKRLVEAIFDIDDEFDLNSENDLVSDIHRDIIDETNKIDAIIKKYSKFLELFIDKNYLKNDNNFLNTLDIFFSKYDINKAELKINDSHFKSQLIDIPLNILKVEIQNMIKNSEKIIKSKTFNIIKTTQFINLSAIFYIFLYNLSCTDCNPIVKEILSIVKNFTKEFPQIEIPANYNNRFYDDKFFSFDCDILVDNIEYILTACNNIFYEFASLFGSSVIHINTNYKNLFPSFDNLLQKLSKINFNVSFAFIDYEDNDARVPFPLNIEDMLSCLNKYSFNQEFCLNFSFYFEYMCNFFNNVYYYENNKNTLKNYDEWINTKVKTQKYSYPEIAEDIAMFKNTFDNIYKMKGQYVIHDNFLRKEIIFILLDKNSKIIKFKFYKS